MICTIYHSVSAKLKLIGKIKMLIIVCFIYNSVDFNMSTKSKQSSQLCMLTKFCVSLFRVHKNNCPNAVG